MKYSYEARSPADDGEVFRKGAGVIDDDATHADLLNAIEAAVNPHAEPGAQVGVRILVADWADDKAPTYHTHSWDAPAEGQRG